MTHTEIETLLGDAPVTGRLRGGMRLLRAAVVTRRPTPRSSRRGPAAPLPRAGELAWISGRGLGIWVGDRTDGYDDGARVVDCTARPPQGDTETALCLSALVAAWRDDLRPERDLGCDAAGEPALVAALAAARRVDAALRAAGL